MATEAKKSVRSDIYNRVADCLTLREIATCLTNAIHHWDFGYESPLAYEEFHLSTVDEKEWLLSAIETLMLDLKNILKSV